MKAEGHKVVATMNLYGYSVEDKEWGYSAALITATPDLKHWYSLKGDRPLGVLSTRYCIADKGVNLEINDHRRDGKPTVTRYRFEREKALASCEQVRKSTGKNYGCNEHYHIVDGLKKEFGELIALQGEAEGGVLMSITANPSHEMDYRMLVTTSEGATGIVASGEQFEFSKWVISVLNNQ